MHLLLFVMLLTQAEPDLSWPINGRVTSGYGPRWGQQHRGIDISANEGKWVRAANDGLVVFAGEYGQYGNLVVVKHKNNLKTYYAHLQNFCVFKLQRIKQGQRLGRVGMTGKTTGPHLHFEVHLRNKAQDPLSLLPSRLLADSPGSDKRAVGGP